MSLEDGTTLAAATASADQVPLAGGSSSCGDSSEASSPLHENEEQGSAGPPMSNGMKSPLKPSCERRNVLCSHHMRDHKFRRSTNSVACQTDASDEFQPLTLTPNKLALAVAQPDNSPSSSNAPEGVLRLMIQNFRNMTDTVRGPSKTIQGVAWRIMVMPRQHVVQKKGTQKCLGFFLQCCPDAYSDAWSCQAAAELRLISQKQNVPHFTRKTNHNYTAKENDWGYSCFMTWVDILDESQGYIKDDRVILEVNVKAEPPKQILSYEEFKKKIQRWLDLADKQYERGMIDLAIEANAQGLKFCKDRDQASKGRLEEQKAYLIEQKLMESIQRIEKGGTDPTRAEEDTTSNQTAVRMAITASHVQKAAAGKKDKTNKKVDRTIKKKPRASPTTPNNQVQKNEVKTEQADLVSNDRSPPSAEKNVNKVIGDFAKGFLTRQVYQSWVKRSKTEDEEYASLAKAVCDENFDQTLAESKLDYVQALQQMQGLSLSDLATKRLEFEQPLEDDAHDHDLQRIILAEKYKQMAERYEIEANQKKDEPAEDMEMELPALWGEGKMEQRVSIIDFIAENFIANGPWTEENSNAGLDDYGMGFSDHESVSSSDSDRANDGSIKPKRSKRDHEDRCDHCIKERLEEMVAVNTCDNGCQTDNLPAVKVDETPVQKDLAIQTTPTTQRVVKKATSVKSKKPKVPLDKMMDAPQLAVPDTRESPASPDPIPKEEQTLSQEQHATRCVEEWIKSNVRTAWKNMNHTNSHLTMPVNVEFQSNLTEQLQNHQMMTALSAFAINMMNTKRIVAKVDEILNAIAARTNRGKIRDSIRQLSKLADGKCVELETFDRELVTPIATEEDDINAVYAKILNKDNEGEFLLGTQLQHLEQCKEKLMQFNFLDTAAQERVEQYIRTIEDKLLAAAKVAKEQLDAAKETEKQNKKLEKQLRDEIKNVKTQLATEKERNTTAQKEIKDKAREQKKLETRTANLITERDEAMERVKQLQKDLQSSQKKINEDSQKAKKDLQMLHETKKHYQDLQAKKDTESKSMQGQIDERNNIIKKLKDELAQERQKATTSSQTSNAALERAKKSEIQLLQQQLDVGLCLLERAKEDAKKNYKEMDDAANNRSRSSSDIANFTASRNEWNNIIEELKILITTAKTEYNNHIDAIKNGKPLSSLPKISVPKPPPPPPITKVAPIQPVEPTKPVPGVIGTRPQGLPPIGTNISPISRAPGSPIQKPQNTQTPSSPSRHPGAIGTRPSNGNEPIAAAPSTTTLPSSNTPWSWSDSLSAITEPLHAGKRTFAPFSNDFGGSDFGSASSNATSSRMGEQNGWGDDHSTWSTPISNGHHAPAHAFGNIGNHIPNHNSSPYGGQSTWSTHDQMQQQRQQQYLRQQSHNHIQMLTDKVSKAFNIENEKAVELIAGLCATMKIQPTQLPIDEAPDRIRDYYRNMSANKMQPPRMTGPPGAAPGYVMPGPILGGLIDRPGSSFIMDNGLHGIDSRNSHPGDKW